jgi:hypothetical protein
VPTSRDIFAELLTTRVVVAVGILSVVAVFESHVFGHSYARMDPRKMMKEAIWQKSSGVLTTLPHRNVFV